MTRASRRASRTRPPDEPTVAILVPRRDGQVDRDATWAWVRAWWSEQYPDWPITEGHHEASEGLFNRSAAINRAAVSAGAWDVAVIIDSDVINHVGRTREGVARASASGRMTLPFDVRHDLTRHGSRLVMGGHTGNWGHHVARSYRDMVSSVVIVPRPLWDATGGFDEAFSGWGFEDNAFAVMCETFGGPMDRMPGELWHLWHPTASEGKRGSPSNIANRARRDRYVAASGDPDAVRALRHERVSSGDIITGIPRIIHRVVPEAVNPVAEAYWARMAELHPGWELRTWRDPIDPAAFPLTAPCWRHARNGAQLADLIRLEVLWRHGGVYVDQDVEPYRSFHPLMPLAAFAAWEDRRSVPNAVIGAVPGHPAIRECIDLAVARVRTPARDGPGATWDAGPGVTTEVLVGREDVLLLPPGAFFPYHYRDATTQRRRDHATEQPWAFAAHHWWGSWLPEADRP